jgi:hypothetical protein
MAYKRLKMASIKVTFTTICAMERANSDGKAASIIMESGNTTKNTEAEYGHPLL